MLYVSLDCPFFIVLSVCSKVYLLPTVCLVSCAQCCTCLWIVHSSLSFRFALKFIYYIQFVLCLLCPMLDVSLDCPFFIVLSVCSKVYLLPTVCPVSCAQCCTCLWIVHSSLSFRFALKFIYYIQFVLCLVCPMLYVSLDCPFFIVLSVCSKVYLLPTVCLVSSVPNVVRVSGLSILHCPFGLL